MTRAEEHVAAAIEILDHQAPCWFSFINLDTFNIYSTSDCVLGQLLRRHPRFEDVPLLCCAYCTVGCELFGFTLLIPYAFANYQDEWIAAIRARREGAVVDG